MTVLICESMHFVFWILFSTKPKIFLDINKDLPYFLNSSLEEEKAVRVYDYIFDDVFPTYPYNYPFNYLGYNEYYALIMDYLTIETWISE